MIIWKIEFGSFSSDIPVTTINGIAKPLTEINRNGLEYYLPVDYESINIHFGIVLLGYHMGGIP